MRPKIQSWWLALACAPLAFLLAPSKAWPVSAGVMQIQQDFETVAAKVAPSVVNISSTQFMQEYYSPFGNDPFFNQFFDAPMLGRTVRRESLGSGVIITADGEVLTNAHVVNGADEITVKLLSGDEYKAKVLGEDNRVDLAVLRIHPKAPLTPAVLGDSSKVKVGQWAIAIGNPLGFDHSLTVGVISAKGRTNVFSDQGGVRYQNFLQTDAAINHGNSGGPLCDIDGQVIGINTAIATPNQGNIGIGFAIPINMVKRAIPDLVKRGRVIPPQLGFYTQDLTPSLVQAMHLSVRGGVLVADVALDGPAAKAGLKRGDVILSVEGQKVDSSEDLKSLLYQYQPGQAIGLKVYRGGKTLDLSVVGEAAVATKGAFWHGLEVVANSRSVATRRGLAVSQGVVVARVAQGSSGADAGLQPDDVLVEVNQKPVQGLMDWQKLIQEYPQNQEVVVRVVRGQEMAYVALRGE